MQITPQRLKEIADEVDSELAPSRKRAMADWDENNRETTSDEWELIVENVKLLAENCSFQTWTYENWFREWLKAMHQWLLSLGEAKSAYRRALAELKEKLDHKNYRKVEHIIIKELVAKIGHLKGVIFAAGIDTRENRKRALRGKIVEWMKAHVEENWSVNAVAQIFKGDIEETANDLHKERMWKAHRSLPEYIRNEVAELYQGAKDHQSLRKDLEKYLKNMARPINAL